MANEQTTIAPLSANAKRLVIRAIAAYRDRLIADRFGSKDEDEIASFDMDITFADSVIATVQAWDVKKAPAHD